MANQPTVQPDLFAAAADADVAAALEQTRRELYRILADDAADADDPDQHDQDA